MSFSLRLLSPLLIGQPGTPKSLVASEKSKKPDQAILEAFAQAQTYEEEATALESLKLLNKGFLRSLEQRLSMGTILDPRKKYILQTKIDVQQGEALEFIPEYRVSGKLAVIVNTDPYEDRHVGNVHRAIQALKKQGFTEFLIVHDGNIPRDQKIRIHQYPASKSGLKDLTHRLKSMTKRGLFVFAYVTGHGWLPDEKDVQSGALAIKGDEKEPEIDAKFLTQNFQFLKDKGAYALMTFDNCYTGAFPLPLIQSGIEGVAFSSAIIGKESECQYFAPELFELIEKGWDPNHDHLSTIQEAYQASMAHYRLERRVNEYGELARSVIELTPDNYERMVSNGKPTLVVLRTTWCPACDRQDKELSRIWGVLGDKVNIVQITTDQYKKQAHQLLKRMGINEPDAFPMIYFTVDVGKSFHPFSQGSQKMDELLQGIEDKLKICFQEEDLIAALSKRTGKPFEEVARFVKLGIVDHQVIAQINYLDDFLKVQGAYPDTFNLQERALLFSRSILWSEKTLFPADMPAQYIVDFLDFYDGDYWVRGWEEAKEEGITAEQYVQILWELNRWVDPKILKALGDKISFENKIKFLKADLYPDTEQVKEFFDQYPEEVSEDDRLEFILKKISPEKVKRELAKKLRSPLTIHGKCMVIAGRGEIPDDLDAVFSQYPKAFDPEEIVSLFAAGIGPTQAKEYDNVIYVGNIPSLINLKIPQEKFLEDQQKYPMFSTKTIFYFYQNHVVLDAAKDFDLVRFSPYEITKLLQASRPVLSSIANRYHRSLNGKEIGELFVQGLLPDDVNSKIGKFKDTFSFTDILNLLVAKVPVEEANRYAGFFKWNGGGYIAFFYKEGALISELWGYQDQSYQYEEILELLKIKPPISRSLADQYVFQNRASFRNNSLEKPVDLIIKLYEKGWMPAKANPLMSRYANRFSAEERVELLLKGISWQTANAYPEDFRADDIVKAQSNHKQ